jgi:hypothetical protein
LSETFAFECYSDEDVIAALGRVLKVSFTRRHAFGQGEVIKLVFEKSAARFGLVDEDPLGTHHALRDRLEVVSRTQSLELRRSGDRYLAVLRPDLELCFLESMKRLKCESRLPDEHSALKRLLSPGHPKHEVFRTELKALYDAGRRTGTLSFMNELADAFRPILAR